MKGKITVENRVVALKDIKINKHNPRAITKRNMELLMKSIKDFPDMLRLREIIVDENMVVLGGNMRVIAMREAGVDKSAVKVVKGLTSRQKKEFTIKDNTNYGEFSMDDLANEWSDLPLADWGVDVPMDKIIEQMEEGDEVEVPQSLQVKPPQEYILILCEPNSVEWEELKAKMKLKMVRRGGYKKGSMFDAMSIERVLKYDDFVQRVKDAYCNTKQRPRR